MLETERVRGLQRREPAHERDGLGAEHERECQRDGGEDACEAESRANGEIAAREGTTPLERVRGVSRTVTHVVEEVRRAGGGAVEGEGRRRFGPADAVAELGREDDPREQKQVLRPLLRPHGADRGCRRPPGTAFADLRDQLRTHAAILVASFER